MNRLPSVALIVCMIVAPALAFAEERGTADEQQACTPDVFRLCSDFIPDENRILACLQSHKHHLSPPCRSVLFDPDPAPVKRNRHGALLGTAAATG